MYKFIRYFFGMFFLCCVFCSCNKNRVGYIDQELISDPLRDVHLSDGKYKNTWYMKRAKYIKEQDDVLNDELIQFFSLVETKKLNIEDKKSYSDRYSKLPIELFRVDSNAFDTAFSGKFLDYFPEHRGYSPTLPFRCEIRHGLPRLIANTDKLKEIRKSNLYRTQHIFDIPTNKRFPNKLEAPKDIFLSELLLDSGYSKRINPDYLFIDLPEAIGTNVEFSRIITGKVDSLEFFSNGYRWAPLRFRRLLLNPAFVPIYNDNIHIIWNLYLFKIKYQHLNDTLWCKGFTAPWQVSCLLDLYSSNVLKYLKTAIDSDPLMYQSYFELILWQMYRPKDFEIKDRKGKKRSFRFTSTNPKYPGNYEVKFDIYQPYNFKVKKR